MGISAKDFGRLQERLAGRASRNSPAAAAAPAVPAFRRVLGLDPSLRGTGYGVIELHRPQPVTITHDTIACPAGWERSRCLGHIAATLRAAIRQHQPDICAVESLFFAQNLRTALTMGEARGAALAVIAEAGLPIYELAPRKVKLAIVGYGGAQKLAVAKMVQRLLNLAELPAPDAADALALALAFTQEASRPALSALKRL